MNAQHCCTRMADAVNYVCDQHPDWRTCPDNLITYESTFDEYGLIIHDWVSPAVLYGGKPEPYEEDTIDEDIATGFCSYVLIAFCPFCGTRLPESKRDR